MKLFKQVILPLALSSMLLFSACSSSNATSALNTALDTSSKGSEISEASSATITTTLGEQSSDTSEQTNIIASEDTIMSSIGTKPSNEKMYVHFIDVDQGDSIFIELPNSQTMLIDAAEESQADKIIKYIHQQGYDSLDYDYQFKKFIIVVPSNPILLGVEKSIKMLAPYFKPMFQNIDISEHYLVYDKNTRVENVTSSFIESTDLSILLLTCHSFNKETNRLRTASEREIVVWDDIKDVAPIVIIDEPQKLDGTAKKKKCFFACY